MSMLMAAKSTTVCNSKPAFSAKIQKNSRAVRSTYPTVKMQSRVHRLIEEQGTVLIPGVYDALSTTIMQQTGISAALIFGYALFAAILGKPDFSLITPPKMAATTRSVCVAVPNTPIFADADTGGSNALNVHKTIKDLIAAGAAGCFLEDQEWPKRRGGHKPLRTPDQLKEMGFHLIAQPHTALYASTRALVDVHKILKENGTTKDHLENMITFEEFNRLVNLDSWYELETKYSNLRNALGTT